MVVPGGGRFLISEVPHVPNLGVNTVCTRLVTIAAERGGHDLNGVQDCRAENDSSRGLYLALKVTCMPNSLGSGPSGC